MLGDISTTCGLGVYFVIMFGLALQQKKERKVERERVGMERWLSGRITETVCITYGCNANMP